MTFLSNAAYSVIKVEDHFKTFRVFSTVHSGKDH